MKIQWLTPLLRKVETSNVGFGGKSFVTVSLVESVILLWKLSTSAFVLNEWDGLEARCLGSM